MGKQMNNGCVTPNSPWGKNGETNNGWFCLHGKSLGGKVEGYTQMVWLDVG